jgi:small GTP-binding protein
VSEITKKICLVGDFGVGKTSLIRRFINREFRDEYLSNVGAKTLRKSLEVMSADGVTLSPITLVIWDIEGSTKFRSIAPTYLQGAGGAIIVADVTRLETLEGIVAHVQNFLKLNAKAVVVIALNKVDLLNSEQVDRLYSTYALLDTPRVLATYLTSAKTGQEVDQAFETLAKWLLAPRSLEK